MSVETQPITETIVYPESDGEPMADNTKQFRWIVLIVEGLKALFRDNPLVFVAGDLLWYPVEGWPNIRRAPDAMVAFGRPNGDRGSYMQWLEDDIPPQVVFEVLSPGNTLKEMARKFQFYNRYGPEEYYLYDPDTNDLSGWLRENGQLEVIDELNGWVSPRLGIRFDLSGPELQIVRPDGELFRTNAELVERYMRERVARMEAERYALEEHVAREQAEQRAERLAARLRALGIDPDA